MEEQYATSGLYYELVDEQNQFRLVVSILILVRTALDKDYLTKVNEITNAYIKQAEEEGVWLINAKVEAINRLLITFFSEQDAYASFLVKRETF